MILDRKIPPIKNANTEINFLKATTVLIGKKQYLHYINQSDQDVIKVQLLFNAGNIYQKNPLIASTCNALLLEGTSKYTSSQIATLFDNHGAFLEKECSAENASISLYCLVKSLPELLPLLFEIIQSAIFSEEEINNYLKVKRQKFEINSQKVAFEAKNNYLNFLIGDNNSYSNKICLDDFGKVKREDLIQFYNQFYKNSLFDIYASGKVEAETIDLIRKTLEIRAEKKNSINFDLEIRNNSNRELIIQKDGALQSAIRIGRVSISKKHPDFAKLYLANTILGGYFGSRLMTNIREDKGYTYGIGSGLITYKNLAYFVISTEVGVDYTKATLNEIKFELNRLSNELVGEEELRIAKNFILGSIMRGFDGSFAAMDRFKMLRTLGLDYEYYNKLINSIKNTTPEEIRVICKKYLDFNSMKKIIVGIV